MDNQIENKPLVDFSSPKNLVKSLSENKDAINEKVDNFNKRALEATGKVLGQATELLISNTDRIAGAAIALGAGGAFYLSAVAGAASIAEPHLVKDLFGDAPRFMQVLSTAGAMVNFSYLHVLGRNLMRRNPDHFDVKGL
jgi:hypothetical protein